MSEQNFSAQTEVESSIAIGSKIVLIVFNNAISVKLDVTNFLVWRKQVLAAVRGYKLHGFLLSTTTPPQQFLSDSDKKIGKVNPMFDD